MIHVNSGLHIYVHKAGKLATAALLVTSGFWPCLVMAEVQSILDEGSDAHLQTVHRFTIHEGWWSGGGLVSDKHGNYYGVNTGGGRGPRFTVDQIGCGTIFRLSREGIPSVIYELRGKTNGCVPWGELLIDDDGGLYGVTGAGGQFGHGTVYRVGPDGVASVVHAFNGADGDLPSAAVIRGSDGNLYGTTDIGGLHGRGTVFKIAPNETFTSLYSFRSGDRNGEGPYTPLIEGPDGMFYGVASNGPQSLGTVYKISTDGEIALVHAFNGNDGAFPGHLMLAADGNFYAGTVAGGRYNAGVFYKMTMDGTFTVLHAFSGDDGSAMVNAPVRAPDGYFYGTTSNGGVSGVLNAGTIFRMTPEGQLTTLHSFVQHTNEGYYSRGAMIVGHDGALYGTTAYGGNRKAGGYGTGTVFRLTLR